MKIIPPYRLADNYGRGDYKAPRTKTVQGEKVRYEHTGRDFACYPGSIVFPEKSGTITKLGICYNDDHSFRYIEIEDCSGCRARYMYVEPCESLSVGSYIYADKAIGKSQELGKRLPGITEHVHLETFTLIDGKKEYFDPASYYLRK